MPDNELEMLLLQRPPRTEVPQAEPGSYYDKLTDFGNALIGDQKAGSLPAAAGAIAGMMNPFRKMDALSDVITTTKQVAPKRAAVELADLLLGRSKRVPTPSVFNEIPEADASLQAMLMTRTGGVPPARTRLSTTTATTSPIKHVNRELPQAPGIREAWEIRRAAFGLPDRPQQVTINPNFTQAQKDLAGVTHKATEISKELAKVRPITDKAGSLHAAGLKPLTRQEVNNLLTGPIEGFRRGMLSKEDMLAALEKNKAKVMQHNKAFSDADFATFQQQMDQLIASKQTAPRRAGGRQTTRAGS